MKSMFLLGLLLCHFFDSHAMQTGIFDIITCDARERAESIVISTLLESHEHGNKVSLPFIIKDNRGLITLRVDNISSQCTIQCLQKAVQSITHSKYSFKVRNENKKMYSDNTLLTHFLYGDIPYERFPLKLTKAKKALMQK